MKSLNPLTLDLEDQIRKRREESVNRKIEGKAQKISYVFGKLKSYSGVQSGGGLCGDYCWSLEERRVKDNGLLVETMFHSYDDGSERIETSVSVAKPVLLGPFIIKEKISEVYKHNGFLVECYVPGSWEKDFEALYQKALETEKERKLAEARRVMSGANAKELTIRRRFGL
jgi:hypothetical protein